MVETYPLLPLRDIVVFPGMVVPLFVGRDKSVAALEAAMEGSKDIFLLAQLDPGCDDPSREDLYDICVVARVLQLLKLPDGTVRVLVEGSDRAVGGTGLGLAIARDLAVAQGGALKLTRSTEEGSEFRLQLPMEMFTSGR